MFRNNSDSGNKNIRTKPKNSHTREFLLVGSARDVRPHCCMLSPAITCWVA